MLDTNDSLTYVLAELNYDGTEKCFYTRGDELVSQERDGKKSYYVYDGHGSVRALFNEDGKATDRYVYDAFGNLISSIGSTQNDFLFAGEQFDPVTGLYYLRARYMNPSVGMFISMDSYDGSIDDPVSLHKYLYANANPVINSDPSGYLSIGDTNIAVGGMAVINDIIMPKYVYVIVGLVPVLVVAVYGLFDGIIKNLSNISAGNLDSGDINRSAKNEATAETQYKQYIGWLGELLITVAHDLSDYWDTKPPNKHHIVMKKHIYHKGARKLLRKSNIGYNDKENLVDISARLHSAIHSRECQWFYSCYVTSELYGAYQKNADIKENERNLRNVLVNIGVELQIIDALI